MCWWRRGSWGEARQRFCAVAGDSGEAGGGESGGSAEAQRDVSVSLSRLGDVLVTAGDVGGGAGGRFAQSLAMDEKLAAANSASAEAQRDMSVSLNKLGDVLLKAGGVGGGTAAVCAVVGDEGESGGGESGECGGTAGRVVEFGSAGRCVGEGGGVGGGAEAV